MTRRDAAPGERKPGADDTTFRATEPVSHHIGRGATNDNVDNAKARADALAIGLTAVALGVFVPTARVLDALAILAVAVTVDLHVAEMAAA